MTGMFSETVYDRHGLHLQVLVGGIGAPLLVLHDEMGYPGAMGWQRELAESRQLHIPLASGYGIAPRTEWVNSVRDLACVYATKGLRHWALSPKRAHATFALGQTAVVGVPRRSRYTHATRALSHRARPDHRPRPHRTTLERSDLRANGCR